MNYQALGFWLTLAAALVAAGQGIFIWVVRRTRRNEERSRELERQHDARLDDHDRRLTALEADSKRAASHEDIARLEEVVKRSPQREDLRRIYDKVENSDAALSARLEGTNANIAELKGEFRSNRALLERIHQFLLDGGREKK